MGKFIILLIVLLFGVVSISQNTLQSKQIPTSLRLIGKWQHKYDSTNFVIFIDNRCSEVQNGIQIYTESYQVYDNQPNLPAKLNTFGEYLWFNSKDRKENSVAPRFMVVKFQNDSCLQIGSESPGSASCFGGEFGYADYLKVR